MTLYNIILSIAGVLVLIPFGIGIYKDANKDIDKMNKNREKHAH